MLCRCSATSIGPKIDFLFLVLTSERLGAIDKFDEIDEIDELDEMDVDDELAERGELGDDLDTFNALGEFTDDFDAFVASVFEPNLSNFSLIAGWPLIQMSNQMCC